MTGTARNAGVAHHPLQQAEAVELGHHQVAEHEVQAPRLLPFEDGQRLGAVGGQHDLVEELGAQQHPAHGLARHGTVVDHQAGAHESVV